MTSTPAQRIAGEVRAVMARNQVQQTGLAAHLGISQSGLSRRLSGHIEFTVGELAATADYLEVPLASLLALAAA